MAHSSLDNAFCSRSELLRRQILRKPLKITARHVSLQAKLQQPPVRAFRHLITDDHKKLIANCCIQDRSALTCCFISRSGVEGSRRVKISQGIATVVTPSLGINEIGHGFRIELLGHWNSTSWMISISWIQNPQQTFNSNGVKGLCSLIQKNIPLWTGSHAVFRSFFPHSLKCRFSHKEKRDGSLKN